MKENNSEPKKPIFLYVVIGVLTLALAGLGVLSFFSLNRLASLQAKVGELTGTVEEISASASSLIQESYHLDELREKEAKQRAAAAEAAPQQEAQQAVVQPPAGSAENHPEPQPEGVLSEPKGSNGAFANAGDTTDASMNQLLDQIPPLFPAGNGNWSVYVCNLLKGSEGVINSSSMQAASLIKLYIMGAVYENYSALSSQYGGDALDGNLNSMITVSDNDAANTLTTWLGGGDSSAGMAKVNAFCQAHGYMDTHMGRLLLQSNEYDDNYTSVRDCGKFLKDIYQSNNGGVTETDLSHPESMYHLLKMQQRRNKIPAAMPEGVHVANKTGELADVENDAGIIYDTAKGVDLVVVFMSENLSEVGSAQNSIATISRAIYGYYNE